MHDILDLAAQNLEATYLRLGRAINGAEIIEGHGYRGILSPFRHAVGNFAVCSVLDRTSAFELWRIARDRSSFYVYCPHQGDASTEALVERSFTKTQRLVQLAREPFEAEHSGPSIALLKLDSTDLREYGAEFVARQFFFGQSPSIRERLARINAEAKETEMHGAWEPLTPKTYRNMLGAVTVSHSEGCLGIYNLCVDSRMRKMGFGKAILRRAACTTQAQERSIVLQCDPGLEAWYLSQGFRKIGLVEVFAFGQA